jgi:RNA polymerase sigma factor (sigma-70 family)
MRSTSDEGLIAGLAAGDSRAAATFVRRHQARVFGLARSMVGDPQTAEEIAQETFVRVWRHADAYDHRRGRVETWLLAIARNLAIDRLRMRRADPVDPTALDGLDVIPMRAGGSAELDDEVRDLGRELEALPVEQRRALLMATLYGYTAGEISELEGAPLGTTKSRIRAAMLKLQRVRRASDAG